jgi:hypothetical protein
MDEVKNVNSSKLQVKFYTPKMESLCWTLSGSAGLCLVLPESAHLHPKSLNWTFFGATMFCLIEPDIVRPGPDIVQNLNLSPTASFLGEPYKYPSTSNGSLSWPLCSTIAKVDFLHLQRPKSLAPRAFTLSS